LLNDLVEDLAKIDRDKQAKTLFSLILYETFI